MSIFGIERSQTNATNDYDHAIDLVDTTQPKETSLERTSEDTAAGLRRSRSGTLLTRTGTLRKQLAQRKYAKYQEEREESSGPEDGGRTGRLRDKIPFKSKTKRSKSKEPVDSFIDVLYENQRGAFFCGIPLYSSNSLLNLDPASWQTANFQDSAVNITNFQLPDPSWVWDWKTWYVDMSHDVDELGWEYSFSFNKFYSWHGNHPWWTSFVRRRRWLRKRIRIHHHVSDVKQLSMSQAHMLTEDYFTIHAANRRPSRDSSANRSSNIMAPRSDEDEEDNGEITNVSALMTALKKAMVDREKIGAVTAFLDQGGDELYYLADNMPKIMEDFIYQSSRRQLQNLLLWTLDDATRNQEQDEGKGKGKGKEVSDSDLTARKRKTDNLLKAVHAAGIHVNDEEYWSDLRARATSSETDPTLETHALDATQPAAVDGDGPHSHSEDDGTSVRDEIKGIPEQAHVSEEPRIGFHTPTYESDEQSKTGEQDKGKGKA